MHVVPLQGSLTNQQKYHSRRKSRKRKAFDPLHPVRLVNTHGRVRSPTDSLVFREKLKKGAERDSIDKYFSELLGGVGRLPGRARQGSKGGSEKGAERDPT